MSTTSSAATAQVGLCPDCGAVLPVAGGLCAGCLWAVSFGANPPAPSAGGADGESAWARLGDYDLYDEIAHGGMGVVYRARQRRLGRMVAVKVLRGGELADPEARQRFRREAESAGRLQHPGVVGIHDVGEDQGVCWFSMDYVPGENLAQRVQQRPMEAQAAAACVRLVAEAIQHAHEHGVLHRDLKPSNILMGLDDQPRVTDFGLARSVEETWSVNRVAALTHSGQTMGSPGYASPEQALRGAAIVQSDVYGLGAVLYHTLTGRAPFVGPTLDSILLQLRESDPVPLRRLNPTVPRDLETICLKCLEKQPEDRYGSAAQLAEDLRRFAGGEALLARPVSVLERSVRWCRRRPAMAGLAAALLIAAVGGTAGIAYQWRRAERKAVAEFHQRELAEAGERAARLRTYTAGVYAASQALLAEDTGLAGELLERLIPAAGAEDFRGLEWHLLRHRTRSQDLEVLRGHPWIVACLAASPDGKWLVSGGRYVTGRESAQSTFFVWQPATGGKVQKEMRGLGSVRSLEFTPDGTRLMLSSAGRTRFLKTGTWAPEERTVAGAYGALAHHQPWLVATESGATAGQGGSAVIYNSDTLTEVRRLAVAGVQVAVSPDDTLVAVTGEVNSIRVCQADGGGPVRTFPTARRMNAVAFSPDGRWLAACGGPDPKIWDLTLPETTPPRLLSGHRLDVKSLVFSKEGDRLITTGSDRTIRFWNPETGQSAGVMRGHGDEVWCALPDPAGRWLSTAGKDTTVRLWPISPPVEGAGPVHHVSRPAVWSMDGRKVLLGRRTAQSALYDPFLLTTGAVLPLQGEAAAADGGWCRFLENPGRIEWFDDRGSPTRRQDLEGNPVRFPVIDSKAWSQDGRRFALALPDMKVGVWDLTTGRRVAVLARASGGLTLPIALNADGSRLAVSASTQAVIKLYTVDTGEMLSLNGHLAQVTTLAFSPDGRQLASGSVDATVRLWNTSTGAPLTVLRGHVQDVSCVRYAPGGKTLASLGNFEALRLWNVETATEVMTLPHPHVGSWLSFSPDGKWLAVNRGDPAERPSEELEHLLLLPTSTDLREH